MKPLSRRLAEQLARPSGSAGHLLGKAMDIANRRPTRAAIELLAPRRGEAILDAGCGTGAAMAALLEKADCALTGVDASHTMLASARRRLGERAIYELAVLENLPFDDASFDAVLALNVLYFDDAAGTMLRSLRRVLRPGGRLVAYVTASASMRDWAFTRHGLHRLYEPATLGDAFARAGFARDDVSVHDLPVSGSVMGLLAYARR